MTILNSKVTILLYGNYKKLLYLQQSMGMHIIECIKLIIKLFNLSSYLIYQVLIIKLFNLYLTFNL